MRFFRSFAYAFSGIRYALRTQTNMRFHILSAIVAIVLSYFLCLSAVEWCVVLICIGAVFAAELINTSIEVTIDLVSPEFNEKAGRAKDLAAAAVLVVCIAAALTGVIIFVPKLIHLLS